MNKRQLAVLEKVFTDEINGSKYPPQVKSKVAKQLCEDGYLIEETAIDLDKMPINIVGYRLTHAVRYAYCQSCNDVEEP